MYFLLLVLLIVPVLTKPVHANFTDDTGCGNLMYVRTVISTCLDALQVPSVLGNSVYYDWTVVFTRIPVAGQMTRWPDSFGPLKLVDNDLPTCPSRSNFQRDIPS